MANLKQQWAILSILAIGLWGCSSGGTPPDSTSNGSNPEGASAAIAQSVAPITNAKRTVALSSLAADILYQLDPDKLAGVAHDRSVAQHNELSQYPNIGDGRNFDVKAIIKLRPDLVVGIAGVHERVLTQLEEAGIPTQRYALDGWDALFETIEGLARATRTDPTKLLDRYALLRSESEASALSEPIADAESETTKDTTPITEASEDTAPNTPKSTSPASESSDTDLAPKSSELAPQTTETQSTANVESIAQADAKLDLESEAGEESGTNSSIESSTNSQSEAASATETANETTAETARTDDSTDVEKSNDDISENEASESTDRDRTSTLILASRDPLFSLNRKSWGGSAIEPFTQNIAADVDENRSAAGYVTLDPAAITQANPDTILIVATPGSTDPLADFESLPFWQDLQAVKNDRVFLVDYYGLIKPATLADIDTTIEQLVQIFDLPHRTASQLKLETSTAITRHFTLSSRPST